MKKKSRGIVPIVSLLLLIPFAGCRLMAEETFPFPQDGAVPGWIQSGKRLLFTRSDLYGHIDGGAELFLEFGFEQLALQTYRCAEKEITVEIYRMSDLKAALGVYLMKCGKEERVEGFSERHSATSYQLLLCRGRYFVILSQFHQRTGLPAEVVELAGKIAGLVTTSPTPDYFQGLPLQERIPFSQRLLRGPIALQSLYTFAEYDLFHLCEAENAVSSAYRGKESRTFQLILIEYPEEEAAKSVFEELLKGLDPYLTRLAAEPDRIVFRDFASEYGQILRKGRKILLQIHLPDKP